MADYYSILDKTISGLPSNTSEIRSAVYKKARTAIETQLRNMNPAPSQEAMASQLRLLEEAIVLIDSEHSVVSTPDLVEPASAVLEAELQAPQPAPAVLEAELQAPQPAPIPAQSPQLPDPIMQSAESVVESLTRDASDSVGVDTLIEEPLKQQDTSSISVEPSTKNILDPIVAANMSAPASEVSVDALEYKEEKSGSFFGGLIKLLVVLGILGGAGYAVWKNKDELSEFTNNLMSTTPSFDDIADNVNVETNPIDENAAPSLVEETIVPEVSIPEPEVAEPVFVEPEVSEPEIIVPEVVESQPIEPEAIEPEQATPETNVAQEDVPATTQQSGVIPIGEVAYLYEEGSAGSGATRTNAAVTWKLGQKSPQEGFAAEPIIIGKMDISEKSASLDITIKRNVDEAVSASHIIEVSFNFSADFTGKSIESIARFVMKATEEAPGEPLVAVPFKASEGKFLIALDNLPQAVSVNTSLLRDASWIDIPLVYETGKRALLTLEKGGTGQRVFSEAFKDWQNR